jgi:1-acyl-sn-glycerol-3-phosphate acyltransferase
MFFDYPLQVSRGLLTALATQTSVYDAERIPANDCILVVSNHRSFLDVPLLMVALNRPVRFACHRYMTQVPVLREIVTTLGAFPLDYPQQRQKSFFRRASHLMQARQAVGIFPEGAPAMVQVGPPNAMHEFHRGFAHLALRAPVQRLAILPVAIAAVEEAILPIAPLQLFRLFDASEPLFDSWMWHPLVVYQRVNLLFGHPIWITDTQRQQYRGRQGGKLAQALTQSCHNTIAELLHHGCA